MDDDAVLRRIEELCGPGSVVPAAEAAGRPLGPLGAVTMPSVPILRPGSTADVVAIMNLARAVGRPLVPLGGASGFASGVAPVTGTEWYLSLERMRRIELIDTDSRYALVEAGVVLQTLQEALAGQRMMFGVDLGGRGSATIGGLIATNAGGERVLRFGMMRENLLGLEVVLADGTVLDLMDRVLKNNAGYDLKQLFVGSEGTLGVVTRAVLRLRPALPAQHTAFVALRSLDTLAALLRRVEQELGGTLSAFELMWPSFYKTMIGKHRPPLSDGAGAYALIEIEGADPDHDRQRLENVMGGLLDGGLVTDAVLARSEDERHALWAIREDIAYLTRQWSPAAGFDVSVPVARMHDYVQELGQALDVELPGARLLVFGHVADNNLHIAVSPAGPLDAVVKGRIEGLVLGGVVRRQGSISAEHGIGLDKRDALRTHRPPAVLAMMAALKRLLDPHGLLNPGKVIGD